MRKHSLFYGFIPEEVNNLNLLLSFISIIKTFIGQLYKAAPSQESQCSSEPLDYGCNSLTDAYAHSRQPKAILPADHFVSQGG